MIDALMPRTDQPPWSLLDSAPRVHPVLYVHRVTGIDAGIYCLARDPNQLAVLRAEMRPDWLWTPVPNCPEHLPLYLLAPLEVQAFAATVSCHQDIASDSAFSPGMLADFGDITEDAPWLYRQRFLEAGILGQVLYLEVREYPGRYANSNCDNDNKSIEHDRPKHHRQRHHRILVLAEDSEALVRINGRDRRRDPAPLRSNLGTGSLREVGPLAA